MDYMQPAGNVLPVSTDEGRKFSSTSGLPRQFVDSMRTLFDILDDGGLGLVPLLEIERRWRDDAVPNLPGVLDCLRAVAPVDGLLSFETFVKGLRKALVRARYDKEKGNLKEPGNKRNNDKSFLPDPNVANVLPSYRHQQRNVHNRPKTAIANSSGFANERGANNGAENLPNGFKASNTTNPNDINNCHWNGYCDHSKPVASSHHSLFPRESYRPFKPGHRRSNSGPITTAKVLPSPKRDNKAQGFATNDAGEKTTKMGFATKFAAQKINPETSSDKENEDLLKTPVTENAAQQSKSDSCGDKSTSLVSPETAQFKANRTNVSSSNGWRTQEGKIAGESNDLDVLTANTLFIRADNGSSLSKPIGLCGKLVGITGTLQRSKTSPHILNGYSSLRRRAKSSKASILDDFFNKDEVASCEPDRSSHSSLRDQDPPDSHRRSAETSPCERKQPTHKCPNGPCCPENNESKYCSGKSSPNKPDPNAPSNGCPNVSNATTDAYTGKGAVHDWSSSTNSNSAEVDEKSPRRLVQPPPSGRANFERFADIDGHHQYSVPAYATTGRRRTATSKRRESRRHTVANGVDYTLLKSMKLLEQEKDLIVQGLGTLDRGRKWFQVQLNNTRERQRQLSASGCSKADLFGGYDNLSQENTAVQIRIDCLLAKISEMTKLFKDMADTQREVAGQDGLNGGCQSSSPINPLVLASLREQNHVLMKEVMRQAEKISQLESEKSLILQQMFEARSKNEPESNTSIFI